jgi:hypothetical protein
MRWYVVAKALSLLAHARLGRIGRVSGQVPFLLAERAQ